jgi:hypothetical protein
VRSFAAFPFFSNGFAFAYLRSIVMMMMIIIQSLQFFRSSLNSPRKIEHHELL